MFPLTTELVGSNSTTAPAVATIRSLLYDDLFQESLPVTLIGAVTVPAGAYYVRLRYQWHDGRGMAMCNGWTSFGMAMQSGAGVNGGANSAEPPPAKPTPNPAARVGATACDYAAGSAGRWGRAGAGPALSASAIVELSTDLAVPSWMGRK